MAVSTRPRPAVVRRVEDVFAMVAVNPSSAKITAGRRCKTSLVYGAEQRCGLCDALPHEGCARPEGYTDADD